MSTQSAEAARKPALSRRAIAAIATIGVLAALLVILGMSNDMSYVTGGDNALGLALPVFLTGLLSFLSPCTLPILPAYFAVTFQAQRRSIFLMSLAFFLGLATTLTLLGGAVTALAGLLFANLAYIQLVGGLVIIVFGVLGMFGKGFAGVQIAERPSTTLAGSYLYGATFALGWTACAGPLFGAFMTMVAAGGGVAVLQGAVLAFIYATGLGLPLIFVATFFNRVGRGSRFWKVISGAGFELNLFGRTLYMHTTSIVGGLLMIAIGVLLATGRLEMLNQMAAGSSLGSWYTSIETGISRMFGLQ